MQFRNVAPSGGGKQSLFVSGGCIVPHAQYKIGKISQDGHYVLRCWGKNLGVGGVVILGGSQNAFEGGGIYINVGDTSWTLYQSADTLFCPADSSLWLTMISGGFVESAMLVDEVRVVKMN
ncbi:MAG TPA: hypothetical protein VLX91_06420 [Candidatus Acidoferrales bacterium]|nr:hypothetical protein [Candidatus Acidoferrales bacterium]